MWIIKFLPISVDTKLMNWELDPSKFFLLKPKQLSLRAGRRKPHRSSFIRKISFAEIGINWSFWNFNRKLKTAPSIILNILFQLFILEHNLYCSSKNYVKAILKVVTTDILEAEVFYFISLLIRFIFSLISFPTIVLGHPLENMELVWLQPSWVLKKTIILTVIVPFFTEAEKCNKWKLAEIKIIKLLEKLERDVLVLASVISLSGNRQVISFIFPAGHQFCSSFQHAWQQIFGPVCRIPKSGYVIPEVFKVFE